jgi:hypothetical protein
MDYVFLIYAAEAGMSAMPKDAIEKVMQAYGDYTRDLHATGRAGDSAALMPTTTATSVRVREGKRIVKDGPFAETREQLGGYYSFTTEDAEEALAWASKIPGAAHGRIEVRPVLAMAMTGPVDPAKVAPKVTAKDGYKEYLFLIYDDEKLWEKMSPAERQAVYQRYGEFTRGIMTSGQYVDGAPLQGVKTAKTVQLDGSKRIVKDGPFAETREQLGGYYRVFAKNLDEALALAAKIPSVELGTIEVRPVMDTSTYV